jgi:hypothetical protein
MSGLSDIFDFKIFEGKKILSDIRKKPSRLLTGVDPASTSFWNKVKGSDDKAIVDQYGGTTKENMAAMDKAGINTGPGRAMEGIAHIVASIYAGKGLSGIGGGASAGSNATNPALAESAVGTSGYGASSASPGYAGAGSSGLSGQNWTDMGRMMGNRSGGGNRPPAEIQPVEVMSEEERLRQQQLEEEAIAQSSKKVKTAGRAPGLSMMRGMRGEDPISENGTHIAAIQELKRQIEAAQSRIQALKRKGK